MTRQVEMQVVVVDEAGEREWLTKQTSAAKRELVKAEKEIRSEIETMARSGMNIAHRLAYLYEHRVIDYALGIEEGGRDRGLTDRDKAAMRRLNNWARDQIGIEAIHVGRMLDAVTVARMLEADKTLPIGRVSESQLRPLVPILRDGQRDPVGRIKRAWETATNGDDAPPTAKRVANAVKELNPGASKRKPPKTNTASSSQWREQIRPARETITKLAKKTELPGVIHGADNERIKKAMTFVKNADRDAVIYALIAHLQ